MAELLRGPQTQEEVEVFLQSLADSLTDVSDGRTYGWVDGSVVILLLLY